MAKGRDKNFVSIWFWLISMLVMAIPLVNVIMAIIWAFTGDNASRKNYFKAVIVVFCLFIGLTAFLLSLGMFPSIIDRFGTPSK